MAEAVPPCLPYVFLAQALAFFDLDVNDWPLFSWSPGLESSQQQGTQVGYPRGVSPDVSLSLSQRRRCFLLRQDIDVPFCFRRSFNFHGAT